MIPDEINLLAENPLAAVILQSYAEAHENNQADEGATWSVRTAAEPHDETEEHAENLSQSHGVLIAYGLIEIEIANAQDGIQYRVTTDGLKALRHLQHYQANDSSSRAKSA